MMHTIISWDCSYRNFFHLIDGLLFQNYPKEDFELIYIEQRTKEIANEFNNKLGLKSLEDRYKEVKDKINLKVVYLNEPLDVPYHLGRCNNAGLRIAKGEIISIMDGDQLLPSDFLEKLTAFHSNNPNAVVNLHRRMAEYPVGVKSYDDWVNGSINFYDCLNSCKDKYSLIPKIAGNIGPMISARKHFWDMIGGYDIHPIWSTVLSKSGTDVNRRLEIAAQTQSVCLPKCFSVHPWHPKGGGLLRKEKEALQFFSFQDKLVSWSIKCKKVHYQERMNYTYKIYGNNKQFINEMINLKMADIQDIPNNKIWAKRLICKFNKFMSRFGRLIGT